MSGAVAQLVECTVRNREVTGSIPVSSTKNIYPAGAGEIFFWRVVGEDSKGSRFKNSKFFRRAPLTDSESRGALSQLRFTACQQAGR